MEEPVWFNLAVLIKKTLAFIEEQRKTLCVSLSCTSLLFFYSLLLLIFCYFPNCGVLCVFLQFLSLSFSFFRIIVFFPSPWETSLVPEPCTLLYQEERAQLSKDNKITLACSAEKILRDGLPYEMLLVSLKDEYIELLECYVTYIHTKHFLRTRFFKRRQTYVPFLLFRNFDTYG